MLRNCYVYFPSKLMMTGVVVVFCPVSVQKHSSHFRRGDRQLILEPVRGTHIQLFQNTVSRRGSVCMGFYWRTKRVTNQNV